MRGYPSVESCTGANYCCLVQHSSEILQQPTTHISNGKLASDSRIRIDWLSQFALLFECSALFLLTFLLFVACSNNKTMVHAHGNMKHVESDKITKLHATRYRQMFPHVNKMCDSFYVWNIVMRVLSRYALTKIKRDE